MKSNILIVPIISIFFIGCNEIPQIPQPHVPQNKSNFIQPKDINTSKPMEQNRTKYPKQATIKAPKKNIKLKKVEDNNFSPEYMYPTVAKKQTKTPTTKIVSDNTTTSVTKEECISMIGQERFDRYVQMLGSQNAAIKRCQMIKAQS